MKIAFVGLQDDGSCAVPPFVCANKRNASSARHNFAPGLMVNEVIEFARGAIQDLKCSLGKHFLPGPVIRVDVMQRVDCYGNKSYVVNEFESLEAQIDAQGRGSAKKDADVQSFLTNFWTETIFDSL